MIVRLYDNWWIVLAQSEVDCKSKINRIKKGDCNGFYTIKTAPKEIINQLKIRGNK